MNLLAGFPKDIKVTISPTSVAVDSNNNIIVAGYEGSSNNPFKVAKFDSNGNLLWAKTYDVDGVNDQAYGIAVDPNDNIIATGFSGNDMLTIKYSSSGSRLWAKTHTESLASFTNGLSVATDSYGSIFVAGLYQISSQDNWIVLKYDNNGNVVWKNLNTGIGYAAYAIAVDSANNILAAGGGYDSSDYFFTVKYQGTPKQNKSLPIAKILQILQKNKNI